MSDTLERRGPRFQKRSKLRELPVSEDYLPANHRISVLDSRTGVDELLELLKRHHPEKMKPCVSE